ncbi:hypothetical protein NQ314_007813 [Rhamnusium bicolor]|uniref:Uncharacterized protein n=1 Tax=Rhamnusium bicolor TaxID=1586634 RepID=A0AAV8YIC4_9CUCU|nr:hypothetical protein NQ314_007813 [Rhamnusium bicolor]
MRNFLTSAQVLESFIDRIKEVNPVLNCVVADRFNEARKEARTADDLVNSGLFSTEKLAAEKTLSRGAIYHQGLYSHQR